MLRNITLLCAALLVAGVSAVSAQTAHTIPVGFTSFTIAAATDSVTPTSAVICPTFYATAAFTGAVASVDDASDITLSGASFTANQYQGTAPSNSPSGNPGLPFYIAHFKSGASAGRFFIITANTATQLTLNTASAGYTLTTGAPSTTQVQIAPGDSVEIVPANTPGNLFGTTTATVPFQAGTTANGADNVLLYNSAISAFDTYFFRSSDQTWRKSANGFNQDNAVILPDQAMFIIHRTTTAQLNLTFLGTVPSSSSEVTDFTGPGATFKSVRFPVDTTVGALALQNLPGWQKGTTASNAGDNLLLWNTSLGSFDTYYFHSTQLVWRKSANGSNQNAAAIPLGTGMYVIRASTATGSTSTLTQALPYTIQ